MASVTAPDRISAPKRERSWYVMWRDWEGRAYTAKAITDELHEAMYHLHMLQEHEPLGPFEGDYVLLSRADYLRLQRGELWHMWTHDPKTDTWTDTGVVECDYPAARRRYKKIYKKYPTGTQLYIVEEDRHQRLLKETLCA